ncbi:hypothetical protein BpHYR1_046530, partial [Brachionus plicatilis]
MDMVKIVRIKNIRVKLPEKKSQTNPDFCFYFFLIGSILIFISPIGMKILGIATRWHFDGTFRTCPTHFHQILMFPAAYILLQNKERETYIKAFTSVKEILVSNNYTLNVQDTLTAEFQNLIFKKYGSNGLFMSDYFSIEGPPFNTDVLDESLFIQVAH